MAGIAKLETVELKVVIFTSFFQIRGKLRVAGNLQTFLNDEQKGSLTIFDAELIAFDVAKPSMGTAQAELVVQKSALEVMIFETPPAQGGLSFLPRGETMVAYTEHLALHGKFFMGSDVRIPEYVDSIKQQFFSATELKVYPLFQPRAGVIGEGPVAVIHRNAFRMFHKV